MQTPSYPLLHAFLADRRSELLDRIGQELGARYPFLQQSAPPEKLRQMRAQFFDGFLEALSEGRCEPLAEPIAEVLLARIRTGMSLADSISVVGVVRRIFMRFVLSAVAQDVEDALPALPFIDEVLDSATARVAALHGEALASAERALAESEARYRDLVELSPDGVAVHRDGKFLYVNDAGARMFGFEDAEAMVGQDIVDLIAPAQREGVRARVARAEAQRAPIGASVEEFVAQGGRTVVVEMAGAPVRYEGEPALQIVFRDVTERRRAEEVARRNEMQGELIRVQQDMLRALSTPLVPLGDGTLLMPLVGAVDGARADQIMAALLEGVVAHSAEVAILDVTGVPAMDASVAEAIASATRAVKLLGARVILTGLSPAAARTLVTMGVDLGGAATHATVRDGIVAARRRLLQSSARRPG